jgi:hypothetical protein
VAHPLLRQAHRLARPATPALPARDRLQPLLAMAHVFLIHFFVGHLRRHNFPMDRAMFEGSVNLDATRHERPAWIALDGVLVSEAMTAQRVIYYVLGFAAIAAGLYLFIGALINVPYISW